MSRDKFVNQIEAAAGLYTTMSRPWDQREEEVAVKSEQQPDAASIPPHRPTLSLAASFLAAWVAAIKAVLPDGMA